MRIAVIGARGQLGFDLVRTFKNTGHEVSPLTHDEIEVCDYIPSKTTLEKIKPDIVINCAAYVRVDDCEGFPEKAFSVNALGARNIAMICRDLGLTLVHISTDYVFDGEKGKPYTEEDIPNPLSVYGNSKLAGEYFVGNILENHYIIRTASLYGLAGSSGKGGNFVETMIKKAKNKEEIKVVDDMIMSPTYTKDVAEMIENIIRKNLPFGTYHVVNKGYCSWFDFAKAIFEFLNLNANLKPIKTKDLTLKAKRPMFSALESVKLKDNMREWKHALQAYLKEKGYVSPSD
jgi:dTDP-4-dehydrorhamnose reductase